MTSVQNISIEEYNEALENLQRASTLTPEDITIQQLIVKVKSEVSRLNANKNSFKGMFVQKKDKNDTPTNSIPNKEKEQKQAPPVIQPEAKQASVNENNSKSTKKEKQKSELKAIEMTPEQRKKNNEIWRMIHSYQGPEDGNYDYSLSYEIDLTKKVPQEVEDLGRFLFHPYYELS